MIMRPDPLRIAIAIEKIHTETLYRVDIPMSIFACSLRVVVSCLHLCTECNVSNNVPTTYTMLEWTLVGTLEGKRKYNQHDSDNL